MKTAICAIVKNEHSYLEEWIAYHLNIGFDDIWIGEDYGSNSHLPIVEKFGDNVHLLLLNNYLPNHECTLGKNGRQNTFYNKLFQEKRDKYDWIAFIDIDEYIEIENSSLSEFLEEYKEYEGVCLAWKYYGANGHINKPNGGVLENYTKVDTNEHKDCQVKSIVNCKHANKIVFLHAATHGCVNVFKEFDFRKNLGGVGYAKEKYWHKAWINHYFTKSWEEWIDRMKRGNMQNNYRTLDTFFEYNEEMRSQQEKMIKDAYKISNEFSSTNIYSKRYSLYKDNYASNLKCSFLKRICREIPNKIAIVTLVKDEQEYIEEWICFHLKSGFDKIIIFEDYNSSSHKSITKKYSNVELHSIREIENNEIILESSFRQELIYNNISRYLNGIRYVLFSDVDEFVETNGSIKELCECMKKQNIVEIPFAWHVYDCNGYTQKPNIENYSVYNTYTHWNKKSKYNWMCAKHLVDVTKLYVWRAIPHYIETKETEQEKQKKRSLVERFNPALRHYITLSYEEYAKDRFITYKGVETKEKGYRRTINTWLDVNKDYYADKSFIDSICEINKKLGIDEQTLLDEGKNSKN